VADGWPPNSRIDDPNLHVRNFIRLARGVWGLIRGSIRASTGAIAATSVLGFMLAVVYVVSHRIPALCIVSHFLINLFIEPGLVLAAVGEMGSARKNG